MAKFVLTLEDTADGTLNLTGESSDPSEVLSRANASAKFIAQHFESIVHQALEALVAELQAQSPEAPDETPDTGDSNVVRFRVV